MQAANPTRTQHPLNRNLFIADNLSLLRSLDNETIDLICIDPPFAKNQTFIGNLRPPLTEDERRQELETLANWNIHNPRDAANLGITWPDSYDDAMFKDIWRWENDVHEDWLDRIDDDFPALAKVIDAARYTHGEDTAAYLTYMAIRIIEMRRILKPAGSLYLHCDHNANAHLRLTLDAIFGADNFRNDLVWSYRTGGVSKRYWPRKHDTILFYVKSAAYRHNPVQERVYYDKPFFTSETDEDGRHYADVFVRDVWEDIRPLINTSGERAGYPTQKPVALAERIILAGTNPGDVVLDCFAGCAYVPVAAERNGRQWIACDISPPRAHRPAPPIRQIPIQRRRRPSRPSTRANRRRQRHHPLPPRPPYPNRRRPRRIPRHQRPARKSLQSPRQPNPRKRHARIPARPIRLHRLVLRLRQPPPRRNHRPNHQQLPPRPHSPQIQRRLKPNHQPRAAMPNPQHPQKQPPNPPSRLPPRNRRRRRNASQHHRRPSQPSRGLPKSA